MSPKTTPSAPNVSAAAVLLVPLALARSGLDGGATLSPDGGSPLPAGPAFALKGDGNSERRGET